MIDEIEFSVCLICSRAIRQVTWKGLLGTYNQEELGKKQYKQTKKESNHILWKKENSSDKLNKYIWNVTGVCPRTGKN